MVAVVWGDLRCAGAISTASDAEMCSGDDYVARVGVSSALVFADEVSSCFTASGKNGWSEMAPTEKVVKGGL